MKLPTLVSLLLGLTAPAALAQNPPDFALAVNGGLLWGGGLDRDLKFRAGAADPRVVWPGTPNELGRTVRRIVLSTAEGLVTLDPATWKETAQPVEGRIVALAAAGNTALAFDSKHRVWRWQDGGQWTMQDSGLGAHDSVAALAAGPGGWVAAGSDRWGERRDSQGEELHPPATWYPTSRIWWSADGLKWTVANLPGQDDGGTQRIETLAGGPAGFLAITTGVEVLFSPDGKMWRQGTWPEGQEPGTLFLHQFAGAFWLLCKDTHGLSTALWRTPDGSKWERLPVARGAALAALLMKDGQVQAFGYRKAGRALEVASLGDFAVVPPPNAAEIAAAKAAEEKAAADRLAAAQKAQAEKKAAEERARALLPKPITDPAVAARVLAACETFERQFRAARSWADAAPVAAGLIGAWERELPAATANAYADAIIQWFFARGDFSAYGRLMTHLPARRAAMVARAHESWRKVFDQLLPLPFTQWRSAGDWALWQKTWPGLPRAAAAAGAARSGWLDVARTQYAALANCSLGACFDLAYAALEGADLPADADLYHFWRGMAAAMNPTRAEPILKHTQNGPPYFRDLAAVDSTWGMMQLAMTLLPEDRSLVPPGEARDLLQKAVALGYTRAQLYLDWRNARVIEAPTEPVPVPRLDLAAAGKMPDGRAIHELPEYSAAIARADQLTAAIAVLNRGIADALAGPDPLALTRHLASFARQWQAAVALAQKDTTLRLPPSPVHGTLSQAASKAWTEGRFGAALLAWLARDRYLEAMSRSGERELFSHATGEFGWATWRRKVVDELGHVMPALDAGGLAGGHDALPPWSPVLRHPAELFTNSPRPTLEAGKSFPVESVKAGLLPRLQRNQSEIRLATILPSAPTAVPAIGPRQYREVAWRVEQPTPDYARLKKEHEAQLAKLPADIARLEERVRREVPMITEVIGTRRVQTGTERVQTTRQGMPYDRPGVQQGSTVVTGSYDRPVYQTVTDTRTVPDKNHPLVKELERLKRELPVLKAKPAPQPFTGRTEIVRTGYDRWSAEPIVPVRLTVDRTQRTLNLAVPFIQEAPRQPGAGPNEAAGIAALKKKLADPANLGAAEVHRAIAVFLLQERLAEKFGAETARREAALVAELLFGLEPAQGSLIALLGAFDVGRPAPAPTPPPAATYGALAIPQEQVGAPAITGHWPVPAGATPLATPPGGAWRLVHDPAVAREAQSLAQRLATLGLELKTEAKPLTHGTLLFPVLAFPEARAGDLGRFLWHAAPEQTAGVHRDPTVPADELRLHAPPSPATFAQGLLWIMAHPSRVQEARAIEAAMLPLSSSATLIDISVSWRGTVRPDRPARTVYSPAPDSGPLQQVLARAGLENLSPISPLPWAGRRGLAPDLVVILRGPADAAPSGLSAEEISALGRPADDRILLIYRNTSNAVKPEITAETSLAWW